MTFQEALNQYARGFHKNSQEQRFEDWTEYSNHILRTEGLNSLMEHIEMAVEWYYENGKPNKEP